jgi:hypothetical protein
MSQAVLTLVALVLVTIFAVNHRVVQGADEGKSAAEVELIAKQLVDRAFDHIERQQFDANLPVGSPEDLTPTAAFGAADDWDASSTIEQFHGQSARVRVPGSSGKLDFIVDAQVEYVHVRGDTVAATDRPQFQKRVTLTVESDRGFRSVTSRVFGHSAAHGN